MNNIYQTLRSFVAVLIVGVVLPLSAQDNDVSINEQQDNNVLYAEYFWDADPGYGNGTSIAMEVGKEVDISSLEVPTDGLTGGDHLLGIRTYGTGGWSPTLFSNVFINTQQDNDVLYAEYFWDADPGYGNGTSIAMEAGKEVDISSLEVSTDGLTGGDHLLGIRTYGTGGWSPTLFSNVFINERQDNDVLYAEYFWDADPGYGNGTGIAMEAGKEVDISSLEVPTDGLTGGDHLLGIRTYGTGGWSPTLFSNVFISEQHDHDVLYAEYFWNTDPGYGNGKPIALTPGKEVELTDIEIPTADASGNSILYLRTYGTGGWSPTLAFTVMVDAEGNYTLDDTQATDMASRNFQSMGDMLDDFANRGVSNSVTVVANNRSTEYPLDLTAEGALDKLNGVTANLVARGNTITFMAAEGSGDIISVSAAEDDMGAVVAFFANTYMENIALQVNGETFDFNPLFVRKDEICTQGESASVEYEAIGGGISTTWTARPHAGTTIGGNESGGTGNLPAMTLTNSGTALDSIAYDVVLTSAAGAQLYEYTYYIYVHSSMAGRTFSGISPQTGASLNPGNATLKWDAISDAVGGYRLSITSRPFTDETAEAETVTVETEEPSYTMSVLTGYEYTWTVTAIGFCDEVTSDGYTFTGRQLPDLTVTAISAPEAAEAGNTVTVTATISNTGEGATTENRWTDCLYYTIDSNDFATAVKASEKAHDGNLAPGASYDASFSFKVPQNDNGVLRFFIVTDGGGAVMESADDNNRLMSADVQLKPFYMNTDDLAALRKLYADFGGERWTGEAWNTASEIIVAGNWSGVTFDTEGRVTGINLQGRGLEGVMSEETAPVLPALTTLNLSRNALTGDLGVFADNCPALTTLNVAYNQIDDMSKALPVTITSLDISWQHRKYGNNYEWPGIDGMERQAVTIGGGVTFDRAKITTYDHAKQSFTANATFDVFNPTYSRIGTLTYSSATGEYTFSASTNPLKMEQGMDVILEPTSTSAAHNSAYPATLHYISGDANISGWVDVNDVQRTLNYVLNSNNTGTFNFSAANTYTEGEDTEEVMNVQDIVCTVNIVLANENTESQAKAKARLIALEPSARAANLFGVDGRKVRLSSADEIAAFDLELAGVSASQVRLLLNNRDFSMQTRNTADGVRIVVFSLAGKTILPGQTDILQLGADGSLKAVQCTSAEAEEVDADIDGNGTTGIGTGTAGDGAGISAKVENGTLVIVSDAAHGTTVVKMYNLQGALVKTARLPRLDGGRTATAISDMPVGLVYVVRIECPDERIIRTNKLTF